jgi:GT2 family glycosyltransferase/glycosyltransferase involved in cell wall biosynthesis/SAM-dependent methyltransferase
MIEWTGERCVPWTDDLQVVYEHIHRYHFAASFVKGKRVADLASGEGYGAAILAAEAKEVVGIDIDHASVEHSRLNHRRPNLTFVEGSMLDPEALPADSFDVVTCFEALEHVEDHQGLMAVVTRILRHDGLLVISTPDRDVYTSLHHVDNPFHVHELNRREFVDLLRSHMPHLATWGQMVSAGSLMTPLDGRTPSQAELVAVDGTDDAWTVRDDLPPTYLVAVASRRPLPDLPGLSTLIDPDIELARQAQRERNAALAMNEATRKAFLVAEARSQSFLREREALADLRGQREARATAEALSGRADALADAAQALEGSRTWRLTRWLQRVGHPGRPDGLVVAARQLVTIVGRVGEAASDGASIDAAGAAVGEAIALVGRLRALKTYRLARAIHAVSHAAKLHADTPAVLDMVQAYLLDLRGAIAALIRVREEFRLESWRKEAVFHEIFFPEFEHPEVSIVVPAHNQNLFTFTCLKAILLSTSGIEYEVIVVDDASSDATEEMLASVHGLRSERHSVNLGFLESCMTGAALARGKYLVFLNNDTVPIGGWLESLIQTFSRHPDAGLVGPKFLNDDGTLQEAGGIVWRDGRAWNYGRGDDPERPEYNYLREVDYCSGACIAIPRELFFALGGFDRIYAPGYYEDSDLAMMVRHAGRKVLYQPSAQIVHFDGMTQRETGTKQYMERNAVLFRDKWLGLINDRRAEGEAPDLEKDRGCKGRVLIIDHYVPTPDQDAGSARMFGILAALVELGYKVTLAPEDLHRRQPYTAQLQALGVEVIYAPQVPDLRQYILHTAGQFDWAMLSRFQVAPRFIDLIRQVSPTTRVIYDTVELGFVRVMRLAKLSGSPADHLDAEELRERELGLARKADVTLVVSEVERDVLRAEEPDIAVEVVSTIYPLRPGRPGLEGRSGILFIGGFDHPPNGDAVVHFVQNVLPLIRGSLPDVVFYIVGSRPRHDVLSLASDRVIVTGQVPTVDGYFDSCRLSVAPLRYGAGVKGKVSQSMAFGLPVVATTVAVEGMHLQHGSDVLVADDPADFAAAVVAAYTDEELWDRLSTNGLANVERHFSPGKASATLSAILQSAPVAVTP